MDAKRLREMADAYEAEARSLEGAAGAAESKRSSSSSNRIPLLERAAKEEVIGGYSRGSAPCTLSTCGQSTSSSGSTQVSFSAASVHSRHAGSAITASM